MHHVFLSNIFLYVIHTLYHYYTLNIVLLSSLIVLIYICDPDCTLCGRGKNIDQKYDQCIFLL